MVCAVVAQLGAVVAQSVGGCVALGALGVAVATRCFLGWAKGGASVRRLRGMRGAFTVGGMDLELTLPEEIAVMTLPDMAFVPQALLPVHIFEPRYRRMLRDVLDSHRLMAVAGLDPAGEREAFEPAYRVATVGVVRACQGREDGTSNVLLQGLVRVELIGLAGEEPYRRARVRALSSEAGASEADNVRERKRLARLLNTRQRLSGKEPSDWARMIRDIEDPEIFVDLAAFNLCADAKLRQRLLETLNVRERLSLLGDWARGEVDRLRFQRLLQGRLADEDIANN